MGSIRLYKKTKNFILSLKGHKAGIFDEALSNLAENWSIAL